MGAGAGLGYQREGTVSGAVTGGLLAGGVPDALAIMLKNPKALAVLERGLKTGASATKVAAAVTNAAQIQ